MIPHHMMSLLRERHRRAPRASLLMFLAACGCSDLTRVDAPDLVERPGLNTPAGSVALFSGAVKAFDNVALSPYIQASALISDEFTAGGTFSNVRDFDRRILPQGATTGGVLDQTLSGPRIHQLQAIAALKQLAIPADRWRIGRLYSNLGYLEAFIAEGMCSGVPLSALDAKFFPVYGPQLTTVEMLQHSLAQFDSAVLYSSDSVRLLSAAQVGRGRVLLNLDRYAEAAAAVAAVPTTFAFTSDHSAAVGSNANNVTVAGAITVADREGVNGLNFVSANDPRVVTQLLGKAADGVTNAVRLARISSVASPDLITNGTEARLIEAEMALRAGDIPLWLSKLNGLRASSISPVLSPLPDPGTPDSRIDLQFREKAFWLFLTGHRLGDLRRLVRQYGRDQAAVFPIGPYSGGGSYGTDVTVPLGGNEMSNNPVLAGKGCIDRSA